MYLNFIAVGLVQIWRQLAGSSAIRVGSGGRGSTDNGPPSRVFFTKNQDVVVPSLR